MRYHNMQVDNLQDTTILSNSEEQALLLQIMGLGSYQKRQVDVAWLGFDRQAEFNYWCVVISRLGQESDYDILQQIFAGLNIRLISFDIMDSGILQGKKIVHIWDFGQFNFKAVRENTKLCNQEVYDVMCVSGQVKTSGVQVVQLPAVQVLAHSAELRRKLWADFLQIR